MTVVEWLSNQICNLKIGDLSLGLCEDPSYTKYIQVSVPLLKNVKPPKLIDIVLIA